MCECDLLRCMPVFIFMNEFQLIDYDLAIWWMQWANIVKGIAYKSRNIVILQFALLLGKKSGVGFLAI